MAKKAYIGVGGVARKVKKGYIGVDGVARKIKKAYIGIGGVARPCWGGGKPEAYGTITSLNVAVWQNAAANVGDYLLFGGGAAAWNGSPQQIVTAYNKSLTVTTPTNMNGARYELSGVSLDSLAFFAGGYYSSSSARSEVDSYNTDLTRNYNNLFTSRAEMAAARVGGQAVFAGGYANGAQSRVEAYDSSLTHTSNLSLSQARYGAAGCSVGNYALVAGGYYRSVLTSVETFNTSLTRSTATDLSVGRYKMNGISHAGYTLVIGGWDGGGSVEVYNASLTHTVLSSTVVKSYTRGSSVGEYALVHGGRDENWGMYSDVIMFDKSLTCTTAQPLSSARWGESAGTIGNFILFAGGGDTNTATNTVDAYILD